MKKRWFVFMVLLLFVCGYSTQLKAAKFASTISSTKYVRCRTLKASGKVYGYEKSNLSGKKVGYIACKTDDCRILISFMDSVLVKYPISGGKWKTAWFPRSAFSKTDLYALGETNYTAEKKITTYIRATGSTKYGYIEKGDRCYVLGVSGDRTQVIYPTGKTFKMAWVKTSALKETSKEDTTDKTDTKDTTTTTTAKWEMPMKKAKCTWNGPGKNMSWGMINDEKPKDRQHHVALDLKGSKMLVYAAADGTVAAVGYNSANGKYVIIKHKLSGKTVYSFYAHLTKYYVKKGEKITVGTKIGKVSNHLHFSVVNKKKPGSYFGYASKFSGNKVTYSGVTFYNPYYIIKNDKLP